MKRSVRFSFLPESMFKMFFVWEINILSISISTVEKRCFLSVSTLQIYSSLYAKNDGNVSLWESKWVLEVCENACCFSILHVVEIFTRFSHCFISMCSSTCTQFTLNEYQFRTHEEFSVYKQNRNTESVTSDFDERNIYSVCMAYIHLDRICADTFWFFRHIYRYRHFLETIRAHFQ